MFVATSFYCEEKKVGIVKRRKFCYNLILDKHATYKTMSKANRIYQQMYANCVIYNYITSFLIFFSTNNSYNVYQYLPENCDLQRNLP